MQHITALWPAAVHGCEEGREWSENRSKCQSNVVLCSSPNANKLSSCNSTDANLAPMLIILLLLWRVADYSFISFFPHVLVRQIPSTNLDGLQTIRPWALAMGVWNLTTKSICIVRFREKVQWGTSCNEVYYTTLRLEESHSFIYLSSWPALF